MSEIRQKAEGYSMPNARTDGMNVMEVYEITQKALAHVRTKGPFLLEAITYRFRGHSMGDPERYRESEEVEKLKECLITRDLSLSGCWSSMVTMEKEIESLKEQLEWYEKKFDELEAWIHESTKYGGS